MAKMKFLRLMDEKNYGWATFGGLAREQQKMGQSSGECVIPYLDETGA